MMSGRKAAGRKIQFARNVYSKKGNSHSLSR
jgi:hypothetical protein